MKQDHRAVEAVYLINAQMAPLFWAITIRCQKMHSELVDG